MRAFLAILGLAAVAIGVMVWLGMLSVTMQPGSLPQVKLEGGRAPEVKADMGEVGMGYTNKTIQVPTVVMENKVIQVPTVEVEKARPAPDAETQ